MTKLMVVCGLVTAALVMNAAEPTNKVAVATGSITNKVKVVEKKAKVDVWAEPDPALTGPILEAPPSRKAGSKLDFNSEELEQLEILMLVARESRGTGDAAADHAELLQELNRQLKETLDHLDKETPSARKRSGTVTELEAVEGTLARMQERLRNLRNGLDKPKAE